MRNVLKIEVKNDFVVKGVSLEGVQKVCPINHISEHLKGSSFNEVLVIDYTKSNFGMPPNFSAVAQISKIFSLPITYGGGINTAEHVYKLAECGASRFYINSAIQKANGMNFLSEIVSVVGSQALILGLEVRSVSNSVVCYNSSGRELCSLGLSERLKLVDKGFFGEVIMTDVESDGTLSGFNFSILNLIDMKVSVPKLICGGIDEIENSTLRKFKIDGVVRCSRHIRLN